MQIGPVLVVALVKIERGPAEATEGYVYVPYEIHTQDDEEPVRWGDLSLN